MRRSSDHGGHPDDPPRGRRRAGISATAGQLRGAQKYQAKPPATQPFDAKAFAASDRTTVRWTGNAGFFVNSRGTTFMIDPLLQGFDMPLMIEMPIVPKDVPRLDAILVTHSDHDHYSVPTLRDLAHVTKAFHSTGYVASLFLEAAPSGPGLDESEHVVDSASLLLASLGRDRPARPK